MAEKFVDKGARKGNFGKQMEFRKESNDASGSIKKALTDVKAFCRNKRYLSGQGSFSAKFDLTSFIDI